MSRCAHEQSEYKLRKLPRCSRCNLEFNLVAVTYGENQQKSVEEWECPKCHKSVAKDTLQGDPPSEWENFLHQRCERFHAEDEKRKRKDRS